MVGLGVEIEVHENLLRAIHVAVFEQRRVEGIFDGFGDAVFAFAVSAADDSHAAVAQGGVHILEVEVDFTVHVDEVGNRACGCRQRVVGFAEGCKEVHVGINLGEAFVVDDENGINIFAHLLGAVERLENLFVAFEEEWDCYDADGEHAVVAGNASHHRGGTGACSATHTGGDEHHLGFVVKQGGNLVGAFFGCCLSHLGVVAGTQALTGVRADEQTRWHWRAVEVLTVGVAHHKRHALNVLHIHVVDGIAATATHTHHFDDSRHLVVVFEAWVAHHFVVEILCLVHIALLVFLSVDD